MLKLAPVFLVLTVILGVYSVTAPGILPKVLLFSTAMLLFLSLLGKKNMSHSSK
jgi:hypothetical protein